ncbi:MAG TPA: hypothetical protein VFR35_17505, partial [Actinoplanes sp.]|nr:hypothetical protein [Actinoplanes sp.]
RGSGGWVLLLLVEAQDSGGCVLRGVVAARAAVVDRAAARGRSRRGASKTVSGRRLVGLQDRGLRSGRPLYSAWRR